jgi:hypothetical protein
MEWVLIFSLQWYVGGVATAPATLAAENYQTQELCKAAADTIKAKMLISHSEALTHAHVMCLRREK